MPENQLNLKKCNIFAEQALPKTFAWFLIFSIPKTVTSKLRPLIYVCVHSIQQSELKRSNAVGDRSEKDSGM